MGLKTFIVSVVFLGFAFHLYSPVPDGIDEPWLQRTYIAGLRLANMLAVVMETVAGIPAVETLRWQAEWMYSPIFVDTPGLTVKDLTFDGIPVRVYRPTAGGDMFLPCVVYFHGGGWSFFSIDSYDSVTRNLAIGTGAVVVAVGYRRAPEHPYPIPFDDCVKATRHVLHHPETVGTNTTRIAVAGDGSGGNLAAAVALRLSDEDPAFTPRLKLQILIQPALQALNFDTPSYRQNHIHTIVSRSSMIEFWQMYMGIWPSQPMVQEFEQNKHISPSMKSVFSSYFVEKRLPEYIKNNYVASTLNKYSGDYNVELAQKIEATVVDSFISPLLADNLKNIPAAFILVSEYDFLRDDGLLYGYRLQQAGVDVLVQYVNDTAHGFLAPVVRTSSLIPGKFAKVWNDIYQFVKHNL